MKTLILTCNTGEGHNACATAIKEYFESVSDAEIDMLLAEDEEKYEISENISQEVLRNALLRRRETCEP